MSTVCPLIEVPVLVALVYVIKWARKRWDLKRRMKNGNGIVNGKNSVQMAFSSVREVWIVRVTKQMDRDVCICSDSLIVGCTEVARSIYRNVKL